MEPERGTIVACSDSADHAVPLVPLSTYLNGRADMNGMSNYGRNHGRNYGRNHGVFSAADRKEKNAAKYVNEGELATC